MARAARNFARRGEGGGLSRSVDDGEILEHQAHRDTFWGLLEIPISNEF